MNGISALTEGTPESPLALFLHEDIRRQQACSSEGGSHQNLATLTPYLALNSLQTVRNEFLWLMSHPAVAS